MHPPIYSGSPGADRDDHATATKASPAVRRRLALKGEDKDVESKATQFG